jgi:nucleoside-diphosphate-sugar epimerase
VLVTGGCGFLGRYIVNRLVAARMNVTVMDVIVPPPAARVNGVTYVRGNLLNLG